MIPPAQLCVAPGDDLVLSCDPGGDCLDHCRSVECSHLVLLYYSAGTLPWAPAPGRAPQSSAQTPVWLQCCLAGTVTSRSPVRTTDTPASGSVKLSPAPRPCQVGLREEPSCDNDDISVDFVNVTISSDCPSTGGLDNNWWRTGWTAGLLWSAVGLLVLIVIIIVIVTIYCFCPVLCLCLPCCSGQREKRQEHRHPHQVPLTTTTIPPVTWTELLWQETVGQYSEVRRDRRRQNTFHEPVVLEDERVQRSGYDRDIFETRNIPDYRAPSQSQGLRHQHHQEAQYEIPRSVDYQVPRIYSSSNSQLRTAKKKSNFDIDLEERIRKASGVARQEHL